MTDPAGREPDGPGGPALAVCVPASSANLGPGFDALAVALDLRLVIDVASGGERRVITEGEGAGELPEDEDNLVWRALEAYCAWAGMPVPDVSLRVHNPIPLERGLGSSAAAATAGVVLGRALTGGGGTDAHLITLAAGLEGHADNAAAALLGGLVLCYEGGCRRLEPTDALRPVLCVPAVRQATEAARGILPDHLALADSAANAARAAAVLAGLAGAMAFEPTAMADVLHEPARLEAMPVSGALVRRLREAGIGACLSGAGPSVLAVVGSRDEEVLERIGHLAGEEFRIVRCRWDRGGATVRPLDHSLGAATGA